LEPFEGLMVLGKVFGQELEGYEAAELGVLGLVHDAHASAAQLLENAVVGDRLARHKGERPGAVILGRDRRASQQRVGRKLDTRTGSRLEYQTDRLRVFVRLKP